MRDHATYLYNLWTGNTHASRSRHAAPLCCRSSHLKASPASYVETQRSGASALEEKARSMWRTLSVDTTVVTPSLPASRLASVLLPVPLVPQSNTVTHSLRSCNLQDVKSTESSLRPCHFRACLKDAIQRGGHSLSKPSHPLATVLRSVCGTESFHSNGDCVSSITLLAKRLKTTQDRAGIELTSRRRVRPAHAGAPRTQNFPAVL